MIHRRKFLKNSAILAAGSLLAGQRLFASGLPENKKRLTVILCGGLWHRDSEMPRGWKAVKEDGNVYLVPEFLSDGRLEAGLSFGDSNTFMMNKLQNVLKYVRTARPASIQTSEVRNAVWDGKKIFGISQVSCGIPRDAQFLYRNMNSEPKDDVWLLNATDLGHGSLNAYLAAEAQSLAIIQHASRVAKKSDAEFELVCLHGRSPDTDFTALHHAGYKESATGYRLYSV
jgi:hypothetical protein